jgi:hypothetical protein
MEKEQSNNQQSVAINLIDKYYILQSTSSHLKENICVKLTQNDVGYNQVYTGCLILEDENTAKAMTCLLNNIDVNDNQNSIVTKFINIYNNLINQNQPRLGYQIEYRQNGVKDKNPQTIYI